MRPIACLVGIHARPMIRQYDNKFQGMGLAEAKSENASLISELDVLKNETEQLISLLGNII